MMRISRKIIKRGPLGGRFVTISSFRQHGTDINMTQIRHKTGKFDTKSLLSSRKGATSSLHVTLSARPLRDPLQGIPYNQQGKNHININFLIFWSCFGKFPWPFLVLFWPPQAPGWSQPDSIWKMLTKSGIKTEIRALGSHVVVIFHFWRKFMWVFVYVVLVLLNSAVLV